MFSIPLNARQYDEKKILVDQCWELIDKETEEAVKSQKFATVECSLLALEKPSMHSETLTNENSD